MAFNRRRFFKPMTPERTEVVADLLVKLVGETVNGKLLRAALVGAITFGSQLYSDMDSGPPSTPAAAISPVEDDLVKGEVASDK